MIQWDRFPTFAAPLVLPKLPKTTLACLGVELFWLRCVPQCCYLQVLTVRQTLKTVWSVSVRIQGLVWMVLTHTAVFVTVVIQDRIVNQVLGMLYIPIHSMLQTTP